MPNHMKCQAMQTVTYILLLAALLCTDAQAQAPYSAPSTAPGLAPAPASPTPAASQTPLAPSPSPADSCSTVSSLGPGNYRVYGTKDALVQGPTTTLLCPGFVKGLASIKANVPKLQYTGQAVQSVSASSVDARLILYCGDQQSTKLLTAALPTANEYSPVLYADDIASIASPQLSAQAPLTSVSLTNASTAWWLGLSPGPSNMSMVSYSCPFGTQLVGISAAPFYGGIDSLNLLCAPACWNRAAGDTVQISSSTAKVGVPTITSPAPTMPPPPPLFSCDNSQRVHIGLGPTNAYGSPTGGPPFTAAQEPAFTTVCRDGFFISQWDVRADRNNGTVIGIGARCSDGSLLQATPSSPMSTALPDVYFTTSGVGQIDDIDNDRGWNSLPMESWNGNQNGYAAYPSFLGVGSGADSPRASPGSPYSGGLTTAKCPSGWHAIGYTAAAYAAGGVNLLDIICAPYCSYRVSGSPPPPPPPPPASPGRVLPTAPTPTPAAALNFPQLLAPAPGPSQNPSPPGDRPYGCGSTARAHIGPGKYGAFGTAAAVNQTAYNTSVCPPGTYIYTWEFAFDTFLAPGLFEDEEVSTLTYIAGMCTRNRTNVQGGQLLQPVQSPAPNRYTKAKIVSNATELAVVSSGSGFGSFALTNTSELAIQSVQAQAGNVRVLVATAVTCPAGFIAIGYTASAFLLGIDYLDIICGPVLPASCPESSIAPPTTGFLGGKDPSAQPFIYTSNPTGPSWVSQATPNKGGGGGQSSPPPPPSPPPPAPNSPGNSIHVGDLSDDDKVLEAVIALTGDIEPITQPFRNAVVGSTALICGVSPSQVTYVGETKTVAEVRRRLLEQVEHWTHGRRLQATATYFVTLDIQALFTAGIATFAELLAESAEAGTFATVMARNGYSGLSVRLVSTTPKAAMADTCKKRWHHYCLDGSSLSPAGARGIIAGGVLFLVIVVAASAFLVLRWRRRSPAAAT